jgi:hypothetical protein
MLAVLLLLLLYMKVVAVTSKPPCRDKLGSQQILYVGATQNEADIYVHDVSHRCVFVFRLACHCVSAIKNKLSYNKLKGDASIFVNTMTF